MCASLWKINYKKDRCNIISVYKDSFLTAFHFVMLSSFLTVLDTKICAIGNGVSYAHEHRYVADTTHWRIHR